MATKIKGIYKGYISKIFVVKEREMEIGYPTDVKHVAHIGLDGPSASASASTPSWMNGYFKTPPDISATTAVANSRGSASVTFSSWSSQDMIDFNQSVVDRLASSEVNDIPSADFPNVPKKTKMKKKTSSSSLKSPSSFWRCVL